MFSLGQRIRELRQKKGISQVDLAQGICTPSMISQIESDRARPSYRVLSALAERLDTVMEKLLIDVDMNLEIISSFKMARAMVASKSYAAAIPLLKDVLYGRRTVISETEILLELATCYLHTGQLTDAEALLNQVREGAIIRRESFTLTQCLRGHGEIEFQRKRYRLAIYQWKSALAEVEKMEIRDLFLQANILHDLGNVHGKMGLLTESVTYFRQASELYQQVGKMEEIAGVYLVLAQSYKRLQDFERAAEYSSHAISIYEGLQNAYMSVKVQLSSAIALAQAGQASDAVQMIEHVTKRFAELGKQEDAAIAYIELAKVRAQLGLKDEAEEACHTAKRMLTDLHPGIAWIHRVMGQVAHLRGDATEALRMYQRAADQFKSLGELREWGDTMGDVSRLRYEQNDLVTAISIMKDIRTYTHQVLQERGIVL